MPKERQRRNLLEEDRQVLEYEDGLDKRSTRRNLIQRVNKLRKQEVLAKKRGDEEYAASLLKQQQKTKGILRKLAESKSRR